MIAAADFLGKPMAMSRPLDWLEARFAQSLRAAKDAPLAGKDDEREARERIDCGLLPDGTALIALEGVIMEASAAATNLFGLCAPSRVLSVLREREADESVKRIWFFFDSPGGSVEGVPALANAIHACKKPTRAIVEGECCSAAYWLAAQCGRLDAPSGAIVGSVGVYVTLFDESEAYAKQGVSVALVTTGAVKGGGAPGTKLTEPQEANAQEIVDDTFALFRAALLRRRDLPPKSPVWQGGAYVAERAKNLGLVDAILT